ncbi:MAG: hypothetical protein K2K13_05825 [Clostridiales bacterium]|nr:hypothetical protein [Clostridiales bacterium]
MTHEIIIRNETSNAKKSPIAGSGTAATDTTSNIGGGMTLQQGAAKGLVAVNSYIKPFVDQMITQRVTTVSLRTGAQELEERMSFSLNVAQKVVGFGSSVAMGALVGGVPGAIVGGVMSLMTMGIEYSNKQEKINLQHGVENIGLRYVNTRAGGSVASFSGRRQKHQ